MKTFYSAYVKTINGIPFYFVKTYHHFPEYENVPPVQETFGMHTNFNKACKIAQICDAEVQQQLLKDLENNAAACKVIPLQNSTTRIYNLKRKHIYFPSLLRLIGLG